MTDMRRIVLYVAAALLGVMLYMTWMKDYPPAAVKQASTTSNTQTTSPQAFTPPVYDPSKSTATESAKTATAQAPTVEGGLVKVKTEVLDLVFSLQGGNLVSAKLLQYPVSLEQKRPVQVLSPKDERLYIAQSGVTSKQTPETATMTFPSPEVVSKNGTTVVTFTGKAANGVTIIKSYTIPKNHYAITAAITVVNKSTAPWSGSFFNQIVRRNVDAEGGGFHAQSYNEAAMFTPDKPYTKLPFKKLAKENVAESIEGGWIAMQQQYFIATWVPNQQSTNRFYSHAVGDGKKGAGDVFTIGYVSPIATVKPDQSITNSSQFYVGPEIAENLDALAKGLKLTIDYGWLWWLSVPIFWVMKHIHSVLGNWGWTIIAITVLIKLMFYHLSNKSYQSMAKMRDLQPRLEALRKRHGDDKQALGRATMEFYKKEKVNSMGGCLPMLVQIPVFIALYFVLIEAVQLRQAPFIFWIQDLSTKDPYFVLPVLMGLSMFVQQKLSPPPPDPTQAKVMLLLPFGLTIFFLSFPAGLVLYWLVNNCLSIAQQWYVMKTFTTKKTSHKKK